ISFALLLVNLAHADSRIALELRHISDGNMQADLLVEFIAQRTVDRQEITFYNLTFSNVEVTKLGFISERMRYEVDDSKIIVFFPKPIQQGEKINYNIKANFMGIVKQKDGVNSIEFVFLNTEDVSNLSIRIFLPKDYELERIDPAVYRLKIENEIVIDFAKNLEKNVPFHVQIDLKRKSNVITIMLQVIFFILLIVLLNKFLYKSGEKIKQINIKSFSEDLKRITQRIKKTKADREEVIRELEQKIEQIKRKKDEVQKEFFKGKMEEKTFNEIMRDYEKQIIELRAEINSLREEK
ncbi:MAG: hypothetical protein QXP04_00730, partial [Candidatus Nanoarchaeia archaeon]|nr:hypothetical protein [Candidatus Jingweiarchaeum tengchongense]